MNWIEILAALLTLISVFFTLKDNKLCWPIGIISVSLYLYLFYQNSDYCNVWLQVVLILQSIMAWTHWSDKEDTPKISLYNPELSLTKYINLLFLMLVFSFIWGNISQSFGGKHIILDSLTASFSVFAMILLSKKYIESWILWVITDLIYIPFLISNQLWYSVGLYTILGVILVLVFIIG
jgi:nicotinamide mononucleotide transporter